MTEFNASTEQDSGIFPLGLEPSVEPPKFSGLLQNLFPDGTIEYGGQVGLPGDFPLTEAEVAEVLNQ
jgi:hypothetical protein